MEDKSCMLTGIAVEIDCLDYCLGVLTCDFHED